MQAPVVVSPAAAEVDVQTGNALYFDIAGDWGSVTDEPAPYVDPAAWAITSDNPEVVAVTPGGDDGAVETVPTAAALTPGTAEVRLVNSQVPYVWVVTVTVNATGERVWVNPSGFENDSVDSPVRVGDTVYFDSLLFGGVPEDEIAEWTLTSSEPSVVRVAPGLFTSGGLVKAEVWAAAPGTATLTLENTSRMQRHDITVFVAPAR